MNPDFSKIVDFIREKYPNESPVPLHAPRFIGNEKKYLSECIDSTYVSYVGEFVTRFETMTAEFVGVKYAIATSSGTVALHAALKVAGVKSGDLVITQALTFVATANSISHAGADCLFIDVDRDDLGLSPDMLEEYLRSNTEMRSDGCYDRKTNQRIRACVPVHVFGNPCKIERIVEICKQYSILLLEDSAESLGSYVSGKHTGSFGSMGILSYNGNKIVTTGGGGMILTNDESFSKAAKHITTTAKIPHPWNFVHDEIGYNYRMPNVNASIGVAQMESLSRFLSDKRALALEYSEFFSSLGIASLNEQKKCKSNYWLNAIFLENRNERDAFLQYTNSVKVMTRPVWTLMNELKMYQNCPRTDLSNSYWAQDRVVNIPSSYRTV
ncbi:LegC family aminotransferase [Leptospira kmetyi]|uniref:LegC family aminotransferase n=1 Tax=Leptospira kmetyi TaxID=408139 RepID=UPI001083791A|nr:LegC family aminotransferase [Leptospira kmetyi]TGK21436.1 LegC family aminotransferase [Leptospira kmetyi]TGK28363.1 LegC family aminotransferase [Leptospira kmetyi]